MQAIIKFVIVAFFAIGATKALYAVTSSAVDLASVGADVLDASTSSSGIVITTKSIPLGDKW